MKFPLGVSTNSSFPLNCSSPLDFSYTYTHAKTSIEAGLPKQATQATYKDDDDGDYGDDGDDGSDDKTKINSNAANGQRRRNSSTSRQFRERSPTPTTTTAEKTKT